MLNARNVLLAICIACSHTHAQTVARYRASIPVIIHVVYDDKAIGDVSDSLVHIAFEKMVLDFKGSNADTANIPPDFKSRFRKPDIEFYIAQGNDCRDHIYHIKTKRKSFGLKRRTIFDYVHSNVPSSWDPSQYLNIYIGDIRKGRTRGYVNGIPWEQGHKDGVALHYLVVGEESRVLTHEVGHWLGLEHIFKEDHMNDTPVQNRTGLHRCPSHPDIQFGKPTLFMNFMNYCKCRVMFTNDQVSYMHWVIENHRRNFLNNGYQMN